MALKGSIKEFGLTEIFQLIFQQKKEGTLSLRNREHRVSVQFKGGLIVQAFTENKENIPLQKIIRANLITNDQLDIARYRLENQKKDFSVLFVELDFLSHNEHKRLSRFFTEEVVFQLFHWKSGDYQFIQQEIAHNPKLVDSLDTQFILMEAIRQIDEWPSLLRKIPSREIVFEKRVILITESSLKKSSFREEDSFGSIDEFSEDVDDDCEDWLLGQINGIRTIQNIIDQAHLSTFYVYQGITKLLSEKIISKKVRNELVTNEREHEQSIQIKELWTNLCRTGLVTVIISLIFFSFPSIQKTIGKAIEPYNEIKTISKKNDAYLLQFALDLYYLKHKRYPDSLERLIEENSFVRNRMGDLSRWSYSIEEKNGAQFLLAEH